MRWQTLLRAVLALACVGVGLLVYLQLKDRPDGGTATGTVATLREAEVVTRSEGGVSNILDDEGRIIYEVRYEEFRVYADGRQEFLRAVTAFRRGDVLHTVTSGKANLIGKAGPSGGQPERIEFSDGVHLTAENGVTVETDGAATFYNSEQKTVIPGPMRFTRGRLSGAGVGADLYMDRSVLWINDQAQLTVAPDVEGGSPMETSARRIGLAEADHYMVLEEGAQMRHQGRVLASRDSARVYFAAGTDAVEFIELRGASSVTVPADAGGQRVMTGENINLAFVAGGGALSHIRMVQNARVELRERGGLTRVSGGEIDVFVATDGQQITRLQANESVEVRVPAQGEQPRRTITAATLLADGADGQGLTRAYFTGGTSYAEDGRGRGSATARTATSESLTLGLGGDLRDVETAQFRGSFRLTDGDLRASAGEGAYDTVRETLALRSAAGVARPKVTDPGVEIEASEIDTDLKSQAIDARGAGPLRVESYVTSTQAGASRDAGLFEPGKQLTGTSGRLRYSRAAGTALYEGEVYLRQGESSLFADTVEINETTNDLTATGHVQSRLALVSETPTAGDQPSSVTAGSLAYRAAARTAVYDGTVVFVAATEERTESDRLILTLEKQARRLVSAEATSRAPAVVRVTLADDRRAGGSKVTYTAANDHYVVQGQPATFVVTAPERGPGECSAGSGTLLRFERTAREFFVDSLGGAVGVLRPVKCAAVIK